MARLKTVFLIHSHKDAKPVRRLYRRLVGDRLNVWLDAMNLQPGQDWQRVIRDAILKSRVIVVCISEGFDKQQGYRHEELKLAFKRLRLLPDDDILIIPVRLEPCEMPHALRRLHRVDLFARGGYARLVRAVRDFD